MNSLGLRTGIKPTVKTTLKLNLRMRQSLKILSMSSDEFSKYLSKKLKSSPFIVLNRPTGKSYSQTNAMIDNRSVKKSLRDVLLEQLRYQTEGKQFDIGQYIIDSIDEKGYLTSSAEEIADDLGCGLSEVETVLKIIQRFEPPGVAARSPSESLLIQLELLYPNEKKAKEIIKNGADILESRGFEAAGEAFGMSEDDIMHAKEILQSLTPYPGLQYAYKPENEIEPEASVWFEDGKINVSMNRFYEVDLYQIDPKTLDKNAKGEYEEAKELVGFINQRKKSIEKIIKIVATHQRRFFITGKMAALRPLSLENVAEKADCHISTVSRAVAGKYLSTPHGSVELKDLFARSAGRNNISRRAILEKIERIIKNEKPENRLSDKDIMLELKKEGILLVRRTVAKYRKLLGIKCAEERGK